MASNPSFDKARGWWRMKYRPVPDGPWVTVQLCKHPGAWNKSKPPRKPPQEAVDRAREFAEVEYRAKHGLETAPARARGLAAYLEGYADAHALASRPGTNALLRRFIRNFLEFAGKAGIASVQAVTRAHCRDYQEWRLKSVKASSLRTERGILSGAWTRAVQDELIAANPWENAPTPGKAAETSITFWTSDEIARIAAECHRPWQSDLVLVLANTGIRIGTALAMEWSWVDWGAGTIKIPPAEGIKTAYTHVMGQGARDVLERRLATDKDGSHLVFPGPTTGRAVSYSTAEQAIGQAIRRSRVRPGTPHDFRHSYGRALALAGVPETVIRSQLGHATMAMTQRYMTTGVEHSARFVGDFRVGDGSGK